MKNGSLRSRHISLADATVAIDCRLSSGIRTIFGNVARRLAKHVKRLILLAGDDPRVEWGIDAENVQHVKFAARAYSAAEQYQFPWKVVSSADLLHVPHYNVPIFWPKPLVATLNDLTQFTPEFSAGRLNRTVGLWLIEWVLWRANEILTLSEFTRTDIVKRFGPKGNRLRVCYPGIDRAVFHPIEKSRAWSRLHAEIGIDKPYLLAVASVRPNKNIAGLLSAFAFAKKQFGLNQQLVIGGQKEGFLTKTEIRIPAGLEGEVKFLGHVPDSLVPGSLLPVLYAGADAFVFPSLYEGFGIPPLEAMACGVPTVVSNRASLPEAVGRASMLIDPSNIEQFARALCDVVSDLAMRERLVEAGRRRVAELDWEVTTKCHLKAYARALNS
jgi:glycosyltransferase involved in cell wall biosynthesis